MANVITSEEVQRHDQQSPHLMDKHAKRISIQDSLNKTELRRWQEDISSAKELCKANQQINLSDVGYLVIGRLDYSIRTWIKEYDQVGTDATWELVEN